MKCNKDVPWIKIVECDTSHGENVSRVITQFLRSDKDVARGKVMGCGISSCQNLFGAMDKIWPCNISPCQNLFGTMDKIWSCDISL
jgi:hypothetical protein